MKGKGHIQPKRGSEETSKLLVASRQTVFKEKYPIPAFTRAQPRTSKHILGLHFEFPETDRNSSLTRVASSHRRVSSTEVGRGEHLGHLLRVYHLIKGAFPSLPEVQEVSNEKAAVECVEAGVVLMLSHLKSKDQEIESLISQRPPSPPDLTPQLLALDQQKRLLAGQEEELRQARIVFDQSCEQYDQTYKERISALETRESAVISKAKATQCAANQIEKEKITLTTACAKMRKRVKDAESQLKRLQAAQSETTRCNEVQTRLKNIVRQESMLNAVAEDLQYQRSSLLAKLETTLTEIAPGLDAEKPGTSEEQSLLDFNPLKDCSNLSHTRDRPRSKGSTQRLYRTLSRERPVDITEIYSEIESTKADALDVTPKGVLTPKSLRSSLGFVE